MKVILFLDSSGFGGIESHVLQLSTMLVHKNISVEVLFYREYPDHPLYLQLQRIGIQYRFCNGSLLNTIKLFSSLKKGDMVHAHGYKASIFSRVLLRLSPAKCITTFHAGELGDWKIQCYESLNRWTAPLSTNLAVSEEIADKVGKPCRVINNFIDTHEIDSRAFHEAHKPTRFAFVGRLSEEKGLDRFIALSEKFPDHEWHVFGDGPLRSLLPNQPNLIIHGAVESMSRYWCDIDVLVMPSRKEGLSMAAIEALAYGTLVVATNVGKMADLVDRRFIVPESEWQMMPAIFDVLTQWEVKTWMEYQLSAQRKIVEQFSAEAMWPIYSGLYCLGDTERTNREPDSKQRQPKDATHCQAAEVSKENDEVAPVD